MLWEREEFRDVPIIGDLGQVFMADDNQMMSQNTRVSCRD